MEFSKAPPNEPAPLQIIFDARRRLHIMLAARLETAACG